MRVANFCLTRSARGEARWRYGVGGIPGSGAIIHQLDTAGFGGIPDRWFSQIDPASPELPIRYRLSTDLVRWAARAGGVHLPRPEHVTPDEPAATDYQLVEDEGADGRPRVRLRIHPAVGPLDAPAVVDAFLAALDDGSSGRRMMRTIWRDQGLVELERGVPLATTSGKVLHLHVRPGESGPGRPAGRLPPSCPGSA